MLPAILAAAPFGLLVGALATAKGLSPLEAILMSALVFAGSAPFVALDLWTEPVSWVVIGLTTLLVNFRHVLMGASLAGRLPTTTTGGRGVAAFLMADETWAMAELKARQGGLTVAYYAGLGVTLYLNWILWTGVGAVAGAAIDDPARYGFDFAFTAIFIGLIAGLWRGSDTTWVVAASAAAAVAANVVADGPWFILAGAIAGVAAAALLANGNGGQATEGEP